MIRARLLGRLALLSLPLTLTSVACSDQPLPSGVGDAASFQTLAGAMGMRNAAVATFEALLPAYVVHSGLLADEFTLLALDAPQQIFRSAKDLPALTQFDERIFDGLYTGGEDYGQLQGVRGGTSLAINTFAKYAPEASPALRGELYAMSGFAEIMLADLFCSGIPLSTIDFEKDYTYKPGSTTGEVYEDALAKFDSAIALSGDSARILNLARVGKGRVLLDLGRYAAAAAAVADVPDDFRYELAARWVDRNGALLMGGATVADSEGGNGLPYIRSGDPRSTTVLRSDVHFPAKYDSAIAFGSNYSQFRVADAVEARLIQAEAALKASQIGAWLSALNALRTAGGYSAIDTVVVSIDNGTTPPDTTFRVDTAWNPGLGGVGHVGPLTDPGTTAERVRVLFRERAFWLFATGHRQGDLRRLIRQYTGNGFLQSTVYPVGPYVLPGLYQYGSEIVVPVPRQNAEQLNPYYKGCLNHDA